MIRPAGLVVDASAIVALVADASETGDLVEEIVASTSGGRLDAPELMPFEVANVLRRQVASGALPSLQGTMCHADLIALPMQLWPHEPLAMRAWELRDNLSMYDASYVALAELLAVPLLTLDARIARAPGVRCEVLLP